MEVLVPAEEKRFWIVVTNVIIVGVAPFWLEFPVTYAGHWDRRYRWLIWIEPIITHQSHTLYWTKLIGARDCQAASRDDGGQHPGQFDRANRLRVYVLRRAPFQLRGRRSQTRGRALA
ncbi:TPA: hypothetical protein DCE37_11400 [Candidatus Latescibacteria bacterium]|nr:hypothetical protein [Candidatus Latescibacterota bacterium]